MANRLIPDHLRKGRILDIGCGSYPYFLSHTYFEEKHAVDQLAKPESVAQIQWHTLDLNTKPLLPFDDLYFKAITMLAVAEHLNPSNLIQIFQEAYRMLQPDGILIVTSPAAWSDNLLHIMARFRLVSQEEIDEHIYVYTLPLLGWYFGKAGFEMNKIKFGYFEFHLNLWATAYR
jgi:SAM-dependent methyltransferase